MSDQSDRRFEQAKMEITEWGKLICKCGHVNHPDHMGFGGPCGTCIAERRTKPCQKFEERADG